MGPSHGGARRFAPLTIGVRCTFEVKYRSMTIGTCYHCKAQRLVQAGSKPIAAGERITFYEAATRCSCGEWRVRVDQREQPVAPKPLVSA